MFLIVRVDAPSVPHREATSTPKPTWEDAEGNTLTLKKVWTDASGKEIDYEEYKERKRRMREREESVVASPRVVTSSCCGAQKIKEEPLPASRESGGCRHRQNVEEIPTPGTLASNPVHHTSRPANLCTCGTGCSCLYCPEHPNNAASIYNVQQQVKNISERAHTGEGSVPVSFMPEADSTSCMGGRPAFFLSTTPDVSQQLGQLYPESSDSNAVYLAYPISQHAWTNQPASTHCSHVASPPGVMALTPDATETFVGAANDMSNQFIPWNLLPNDSNGTWNFADGLLGETSFSWTDYDASRGTDYNIGQATVASMAGGNDFMMPPTGQQTPLLGLNLDPMTSPSNVHPMSMPANSAFTHSTPQYHPQMPFSTNFRLPAHYRPPSQGTCCQKGPAGVGQQGQELYPERKLSPPFNSVMQPLGMSQVQASFGLTSGSQTTPGWEGYDLYSQQNISEPEFLGTSIPSSPPIANQT
jgi:hypothetical protein